MPDLASLLRDYEFIWLLFWLYFPLGVIGAWRWGVWLIKKLFALTYRPMKGSHDGTVAVITPVYNENPAIFTRAINSWRDNGVEEIVAVIDYTDTRCIAIFEEFTKAFPDGKMIVTKKPGKRPALVDGIKEATTEFVALVDSDTIWGDEVKKRALIPFANPKIGGVATRQSVLNPVTLAQRLFNAQLNLRYLEELPFMVAFRGKVITCLSGRTAFYRREAVLPLLPGLEHETFWGKPVISGDDKRLTYLLEGAGWHVAFQQNAHVYTPGMADMKAFLKQRLRWTRNSWRADLRTLTQPWTYRYPRFALYLMDRVLQPFAQLLSPVFFVVAIALGLYLPALLLFIWWHIGRLVRMWPYLRRHPSEIKLIPFFVWFNFYAALMKVYALVTLNRQGWITRWDKNRLPGAPALLRIGGSYVVTGLLIAVLATGVTLHERAVQAAQDEELRPPVTLRPLTEAPATRLPEPTFAGGQLIARYEVQPGDTLQELSRRWQASIDDIIRANAALLPSRDYFEVGLVLNQPTAPHTTNLVSAYSSAYEELGPLRITYVADTNTIEVRGRGQQVTLYDIAQRVTRQQLRELTGGEWYLGANVALKAGVSLRLEKPETTWLKLRSDEEDNVVITAEDAQILLQDTKVTSWNNSAGEVDTNYINGRGYIVVRGNSRLDIFDSELAYLGAPVVDGGPTATTGVSWKGGNEWEPLNIVTGEVRGSAFHHNFDGAYASGATGMHWANNTFSENARYGLDLYDRSNNFVIEDNETRNSGLHGIILAERSTDNIVRHNYAHHNGRHGIMLFQKSDRNVVTANTVTAQLEGIVLHSSSANTITANVITEHTRGIRASSGAVNNALTKNTIRQSSESGVHVAAGANESIIRENIIDGARVGITIKSNANEVVRNKVGGVEIGFALREQAQSNRLEGNALNVGHRLFHITVPPNVLNYADVQ